MFSVTTPVHPRHGLALWATTKMIALPATPELGLVLEDIQRTPTRVGTWQSMAEMVETKMSRPWDTSSFSEKISAVNVRKLVGQGLI